MATKKPDNFLSGSMKPGGTYKTWDNSKGYVKPDMGKGKGAAIPYQEREHKVKKEKPKPKPKPPKNSKDKVVRAKRGDTISSIAGRHGMSWQDLYKYNTTSGNRNSKAIKTLKNRGPNLIYKGTAFKIPAARLAAIKRKQGK